MNNHVVRQLIVLALFSFWSCASCIYSQKVIKILAIGNSFSQDAAESYVDDLAKADGVKLIIANMYIGGCSLETHWKNANENKAVYSYRKITEGDTVVIKNQTLCYAIKDEHWDYITFQQASPISGNDSTYFPYLTNLLKYVKGLATNKNVKFALHQTWADAANSTNPGFVNYNKDQNVMYHTIVNVQKKIAAQVGIKIIIPSGTAIQNVRSSYIGDNLCRDGHHLSFGIGRYTAACTWYEKLLGRPVIGNSFVPQNVSASDAKIAQYGAHDAVRNPDKVTSMAKFIK